MSESSLPRALRGQQRHLFLSPHCDDVALSCGATAVRLRQAGLATEVFVVFGDTPAPTVPLTPFAEYQHEQWGLGPAEAIAARRREEEAAAAILGAGLHFLPFSDAIYRNGPYLDDRQLFGPPAPGEASLPAKIVAAAGLGGEPDPGVRLYAPLGVGNHVDHQHTFAAGGALGSAGWDVWFYEDQPYAMEDGAVEARLAALDLPLTPVVVPVGAAWDAKMDAIVCYQSQLRWIFRSIAAGGSREAIASALGGYAARVGDGALGERFWRFGGRRSG